MGAHRSAAGTARAVCTGVKRAAAHWRRCASAGAARAVFAGAARARRSAGRRGGRFRDAGSRSLPSGRRREAGHGRAWPREAHKDRVAGAAARGGHVAGRCGTGGFRGFPGRTRGRRGGQRARGGKAGAAARCRGAGKIAAPSAACVGFQATSAIEAAGEKARFCLIRKRFFPGAALVKSELFCARILVASVGLLFRRRRVMNVSRRARRAKKPCRKTKRPSERSAPHEKPDFRYRD